MTNPSKILIVEDQFVEANHLRIMLKKAGYGDCPIARSVGEALEQISLQRPDLVLLDIFLAGPRTGIDLAWELRKNDIAFIYLSANSNEDILHQAKETHPYGFLVKPFREKDLLINLQIAAYHHQNGLSSFLKKERQIQQALQQQLEDCTDIQTGLTTILHALQPAVPFDLAVIVLENERKGLETVTGHLRIGFDEYQVIDLPAFQKITKLKAHELQAHFGRIIIEPQVRFYNEAEFDQVSASPGMKHLIRRHFQMNSSLVIPLHGTSDDKKIWYVSLYSRQTRGFSEEAVHLCERLQQTLSAAVRKLEAHSRASNPLSTIPPTSNAQPVSAQLTNAPSAKGPGRDDQFSGIIGRSPALLQVFDQMVQVARTETTVLILGESGTGKESIADSLHALSPRSAGPFVRVNCAALPANLIESELFGHEKGAFTGATDRRAGRFEQANHGTLLLDEIGEMPLEMQSRLLRVLQQKEIERLGGRQTIRIDVRIIAATNRDLEKEVAEGRFRLDLYYRLNVFPIELPPLRERKEDIALLAQHFIAIHSRRHGRSITGLSDAALQSLSAYHWPGNIRELENLIERSVIVAKGSVIDDLRLPSSPALPGQTPSLKTIDENEREYILAVLARCNGRIRGEGGAAQILGVPPTTLNSKMKRLGIKRAFSMTTPLLP